MARDAVLVAVDFSAQTGRVLEEASRYAAGNGLVLDLVHVTLGELPGPRVAYP